MAPLLQDVLPATFVLLLSLVIVSHLALILHYIIRLYFVIIVLAVLAIAIAILTSFRKARNNRPNLMINSTVAFIRPGLWNKEISRKATSSKYTRQNIWPAADVSKNIDELLSAITHVFIRTWYHEITKSAELSSQIDALLGLAISKLVERVRSQDIVLAVTSRMVPILTQHLRNFNNAEHAVRGKKLNRNVTESEELDLAIAAKYDGGNLHPAAALSFSDTKILQQDYLKTLVGRLLPIVLPKETYQSRVVSVLVTEIVSCGIFMPIMQAAADPDFWNQSMEGYGKVVLQDRNTVRKMRMALDKHTSPAVKSSRSQLFPRISANDDERKFERFVRAIRKCNNLAEARRCRNEVTSQLKREALTQDQNSTYIRRLETGKRILDQRVAALSFSGSSKASKSKMESEAFSRTLGPAKISLREILDDTSRLPYFMEFMDRQNLLTMVQFWLVVEGIRSPLEDEVPEDNGSVNVPIEWTKSDRQDIAQISDSYLSRPELEVSDEVREMVHKFLQAEKSATAADYSRARKSIMQAQRAMYEKMEEVHSPAFQKSDLYYKLLTSRDATSKEPNQLGFDRLNMPHHDSPEDSNVPNDRLFDSDELAKPSNMYRERISSYTNMNVPPKPSSLPESVENGGLNHSDAIKPLFDDDAEVRQTDHATQETDTSKMNQRKSSHWGSVEAIEAALTHIAKEPNSHQNYESMKDEKRHQLSLRGESPDLKMHQERQDKKAVRPKYQERPNIASLGLVSASSRIGVFTDNDLFGDEPSFLEDEHADPEDRFDSEKQEEAVHQAAPGDLGLAEAISVLRTEIDRLIAQESIVDTLIRKAELTNNVAEIRILSKSKSSLQRELRRKELQRQQYIVQESDNSLYGRATISIKSIMVGKEDDGQEFALYVIEVCRNAGKHMPAASWVVARRYSEFHELHQRLRYVNPAVRQLEFPRRRLVMKLQHDFLQKRRVALEIYLRELLHLPAVCRSRDLRAFLSQQPILPSADIDRSTERSDLVSRIYNSVTDGMDEFLGNIPVLDQLSLAGQNLILAATNQYQGPAAMSTPHQQPYEDNQLGLVEITSDDDRQLEIDTFEAPTLATFVKPVCDLFLEIFELNRSQNWLRGRAVIMVLQQLLGGTVERKIRETANSFVSDSAISLYLVTIKDQLWPDGNRQPGRVGRSAANRAASRKEAGLVVATLVPDLAGGIVGRANARAAGRRLFAAFNNHRLNTHLAFQLLDELIIILFKELASEAIVEY